MIGESLGIEHVAVLMGANIATDVAKEQFVESTLACQDLEIASSLAEIFQSPTFQVQICQDTITTEICGAFKNVIAMGAGSYSHFLPR
jgi:glycerol-3-phosphate dehydrogenase (NAD+)